MSRDMSRQAFTNRSNLPPFFILNNNKQRQKPAGSKIKIAQRQLPPPMSVFFSTPFYYYHPGQPFFKTTLSASLTSLTPLVNIKSCCQRDKGEGMLGTDFPGSQQQQQRMPITYGSYARQIHCCIKNECVCLRLCVCFFVFVRIQ